MQLDPGERALTAPFRGFEQAIRCKEALQAAGFATVQVDRVGEFGYDAEPRDTPTGQGDSTTQNEVYIDEANQKLGGPSARVLTAASPEVSGMSGPVTAKGLGVLLTLVLPTARSAEAEAIVRAHGGQI